MNFEQTISYIRTELAAGLTITLAEYLAESMKLNADKYCGTEPTDVEVFWSFLDDLERLHRIDLSGIDRDALYDRVVARINPGQVMMKDLERRAIAHYINRTQTKLAALRDAVAADLSASYMHDKSADGPTYHRTYVEDIRATLAEIQLDLDKVARRSIWNK